MDIDRLTAQLQALPPELPNPVDRLEQVHQRVRRHRRRRVTAALVGGVAAMALTVPAALQLLPQDAAAPAGPDRSVTTTALSEGSAGDFRPGMTRAIPHSEPVTATHTGTAAVDLGDRPAEATAVSFDLECLSPGQFTWPVGNVMGCNSRDVTHPDPAPPYPHLVDLVPGQEQLVIEATDGASWRISTTYVSTEITPWGVNAKGETYGVANDKGAPDLIAVAATNGRSGYAYDEELSHPFAPQPTSPEDALAQQEANKGKVFRVPVYESDGETVIGEFLIGGREDDSAATTGG